VSPHTRPLGRLGRRAALCARASGCGAEESGIGCGLVQRAKDAARAPVALFWWSVWVLPFVRDKGLRARPPWTARVCRLERLVCEIGRRRGGEQEERQRRRSAGAGPRWAAAATTTRLDRSKKASSHSLVLAVLNTLLAPPPPITFDSKSQQEKEEERARERHTHPHQRREEREPIKPNVAAPPAAAAARLGAGARRSGRYFCDPDGPGQRRAARMACGGRGARAEGPRRSSRWWWSNSCPRGLCHAPSQLPGPAGPASHEAEAAGAAAAAALT
jgi:hypothetical protein